MANAFNTGTAQNRSMKEFLEKVRQLSVTNPMPVPAKRPVQVFNRSPKRFTGAAPTPEAERVERTSSDKPDAA